MSLVLLGSTSGSITLQEPAVAGSTTINLPATTGTALVAPTALTVPNTTGTVMVSGNMPAFHVQKNANQSISGGANTKATLTNELFDTANCYDTSTSRFTPNVSGYYLFTVNLRTNAPNGEFNVQIYKNTASTGASAGVATTTAPLSLSVSVVLYMNGTTDYVEVYVYTANNITIDASGSFSGSMIRGA